MNLGELFTGLGYVTGFAVLLWAARERKLLTLGMLQIALISVFAGALGAKLTEFIFEGWPVKINFAAILDPDSGGKSLLGGLVIGWLAAVLAKRSMGIKRTTGDLFALALPAGEAVGRIGCYFNGCCYGTVASGPITVYQHGAWRHPAQLYSSATAALIFLVLYILHRDSFGQKHFLREGDLFKLYLVLFGVTRFAIEFIREKPLLVFGLSAMQVLCFELVIYGAVALWFAHHRRVAIQGASAG